MKSRILIAVLFHIWLTPVAWAQGAGESPTASCDKANQRVDFTVEGIPSQAERPLSFGQGLTIAIPSTLGAKLANLEIWVDTDRILTLGRLELQSFPVAGTAITIPFTLSIARDPDRPLLGNQTYSLPVKQAASSKLTFIVHDSDGGCGSSETTVQMGSIDTYGLVLGFNYSTRQHALKYAASDAEAVVSHLVNQLKVKPANIWLLTDGASSTQPSQASGVNRPKIEGPQSVEQAMTQILSKADNQSRLFIYFSGHIFVRNENVDQGKTQLVAYLMLPESDINNPWTAFSRPALLSKIQGLPLASVVLILDACYSGTDRSAYANAQLPRPMPGVKSTLHLLQPIIDEDRTPRGARLASSDGSSPSWEFDEIQHGVFTYYMINASKDKSQVTLHDAFIEASTAMGTFTPKGWTKPLSQTPLDAWGRGGTEIPWRTSTAPARATTQ